MELGKVPPVMDGVGRRDLAAGSVIETIHYGFHNSTIPRLHFGGDNYAERLTVGLVGKGENWRLVLPTSVFIKCQRLLLVL